MPKALDTMHRVYVGWEDESGSNKIFMSTLAADFHRELQVLVADHGPPTTVEFRADDEGWYTEAEIKSWEYDDE